MNQLYRALHMPLPRLVKKLTGWKEIYTIAVRPLPPAEGAAPLPALGGAPYTPLPETPGVWYADPLLYRHEGERFLFCEAFDMAAGRGDIAVFRFDGQGLPTAPQIVLREDCHLSFPMVFDWNGEVYMIPESGESHTLRLYRCAEFPGKWERAACFEVNCELCDTILLEKTPDTLSLLCSETKPDNQLYVRYRHYRLRRGPAGFSLEKDEAFCLQHRDYDLTSRNAGPLFALDGQLIHPTQVSTKVDYGVYLQFFARQGASEVPLCAAMPENVVITGIDPASVIGVHTYCRDDAVEVIDARYLKKLPRPAEPSNKKD